MSKIEVVHIVAHDLNGCIGNNGKIPWHLPADLKRFKELTSGGVVVMGRKTFESLDCKPLPNRVNIVITKDPKFQIKHKGKGIIFYNEISFAIQKAKYEASVLGLKEVWIIGGQSIYEQTMPYVDRIELTRISGNYNGDTYYPTSPAVTIYDSTGTLIDPTTNIKYEYLTFKVNKEMSDIRWECEKCGHWHNNGELKCSCCSKYEPVEQGRKHDSNKPKAVELLDTSAATLIRCGKKYDSTGNNSERVMDRIVDMFNAATGHELTEAQGNIFMVCLKVVRSETSTYHDDDHYIDGINYFAMAGESSSEASTK